MALDPLKLPLTPGEQAKRLKLQQQRKVLLKRIHDAASWPTHAHQQRRLENARIKLNIVERQLYSLNARYRSAGTTDRRRAVSSSVSLTVPGFVPRQYADTKLKLEK